MGWFRRHIKAAEEKAACFPALDTPRLVLRMFTPGDAADLFAYAQDPQIGPLAGWPPHQSLEESRSVVANFIRSGDVWAVVEKTSGRVIGTVGLHIDRKRDVENTRMLGYVLGARHWGRGYATEAAGAALRFAFEELGCQLVSVYHYPHNARSRRVIQKLGFVAEGTLRRASTLPGGQVADDVCYSLTREEYRAQTAQPK